MVPNNSRFSGTSAMPSITRSSSVSSSTDSPLNSMRPWLGSKPIRLLRKVDLPAPFGPITVITLPLSACRLRPCSTSARP
jgi:hypothetical protein